MTPKVYMSQLIRGLDYRDLEAKGDIVFLLEDEYPREPSSSLDKERIMARAERKFEDYVPGRDYIALTPSPMSCLIAGVLMAKRGGDHKVLKWNNRRMDYDELRVFV